MLKSLCPILVVYHYHIIVPNKMVPIGNIHPSKCSLLIIHYKIFTVVSICRDVCLHINIFMSFYPVTGKNRAWPTFYHVTKLKKCSEHIFTDRYLYSFLCKRFQIVCQSPSYVVILPNEYLNKDRRLGIDKFLTNLINSLSTIYKKLERAQICCWHGEK